MVQHKNVWLMFSTLALSTLTACPSTPAPVDASMLADTPSAMLDAGADSPSTGCENFAGYYQLATTCTSSLVPPIASACVTQDGCNVRVTSGRTLLVGTVSGGTMTFGTETPTTYTCRVTRGASGVTLACEVPALSATCSGRGATAQAANASNTCCDVSAPTCTAAGDRCTLVNGSDMGSVSACIPTTGALTEGMTCVRDMSTMDNVGRDLCAAGLFCARTNAPSGTRTCARLCNTPTGCGAGFACEVVSSVDTTGVCAPRCEVFTDTCGEGRTCGYSSTRLLASGGIGGGGACRPVGTTAPGAACVSDSDCGTLQGCVRLAASPSGFVCQPMCDGAHPCLPGDGAGQECVAIVNGDTRGFCVRY